MTVKIDNERYFREDLRWWDDGDDHVHIMLRHIMNPIRFGYFQRIIQEKLPVREGLKTLLDVGCGGGFLSEEFAKIGFEVTGMDPSPSLLKAAERHALQNALKIRYIEGYGENIPLEGDYFDFVACCDVLEHVNDLNQVIGEISRVLKPGGVFFFDTVSRTLVSYLMVIKIAQDWRFTAWEEPRTHVWQKFIKPSELTLLMTKVGLIRQEIKGIAPGINMISSFRKIRKRAQGKISRLEMARGFKLHESTGTAVSYMGYARKEIPG
jgi:2-polyprenyl-6-hydroxyphenyl methylase / 3-demethylubiquinone-9 3-methyltransferase